jgi:hypothetical protein
MVTCQEKNGWKAQDHMASAIVPPWPLLGEAAATPETPPQALAPAEKPEAQPAPLQPSYSSLSYVYKGGTPDVPGLHTYLKRVQPLIILCTPLVHGFMVAMDKLGMLRKAGMGA